VTFFTSVRACVTVRARQIEDFGVHANAYYALDVSYFKSSLDGALLDLLWNKYWVNTLSSTPARTNIDFMVSV
jgi:COP9 signalosome complex subunit 5